MYKLEKTSMIRTPSLPYCYLENYKKQKKDIISFIKHDPYLDVFFRKALLISSRTLYDSYMCVPEKKKKRKNLEQSLYKYFIRATTRPTPYGYYSGVALCEISEGVTAPVVKDKNNKKIDLCVDSNWINKLVNVLEEDDEILEGLKLIRNSSTFFSGDRVKNLVYVNGGASLKDNKSIDEIDIRKSPLIFKLFNILDEFISYSDLVETIKKDYDGVSSNTIKSFIKTLIKNEFILTNLRLPAYYTDGLEYVVNTMKKIPKSERFLDLLLLIQTQIESYKNTENEEELLAIYKNMESLQRNDNYLALNKGDILTQNKLDRAVIESNVNLFINTMTHLSVESSQITSLKRFKNAFIENYGENVEVPLLEIIDKNRFDGLSLIDFSRDSQLSTRESRIKMIIENKITEAVKNDGDVNLAMRDFSNISKLDTDNYFDGFDLNFFVTKDDNNQFKFSLSPGTGSTVKGGMYERFVNCLTSQKLFEEKLQDKEYLPVEIRERGKGKINNIINPIKVSDYYLPISCYGNENNRLHLSDLYVGLDYSQTLYVKSTSLNHKIEMVQNNMMNTMIGSELYQFFLRITESHYNNFFYRLSDFVTTKIYNPRVYIENVLIKGKSWYLNDSNLTMDNYDDFLSQLKELIDRLSIDDFVYLSNFDNRLILNLKSDNDLKLLFSEYKKKKSIELNELEPFLFKNPLVKDEHGNGYISEFVFSFGKVKYREKNLIKDNKDQSQLFLQENDRSILPFEDGWIYFKIYGLGNRTNEFIICNLHHLFGTIICEKYFFIRYADSKGEHIRLRIKFINQADAISSIPLLYNWIKKEAEKRILNGVVIDTYHREHNRYGGSIFTNFYEDVFCADSVWVAELLKKEYTKEEKLNIHILGVVSVLKEAFTDHKDALIKLDSIVSREAFKQEYRLNKKSHISLVENAWNTTQLFESFVSNAMQERTSSLVSYFSALNSERENVALTNTIPDIALSLSHMFCNRLNGNREYETKVLAIIRHSLHDMIQKKEHE